jgi:hypothetical protein
MARRRRRGTIKMARMEVEKQNEGEEREEKGRKGQESRKLT